MQKEYAAREKGKPFARAVDDTMKKNKALKIVLIVLGALAALLLLAALGVFLYLRHLTAAVPDTLPEDTAASVAEPVLTDDELDKLLSGEISLDELSSELPAETTEEDASASVPEEEPAAAEDAASEAADSGSTTAGSASSGKKQGTASSASSGSTAGASSAASSGSGSTASSSAPAASSKAEEPYEAEVRALLKQLYATKARAEAELNACVEGAKTEYHSLPEYQQTQARKVSIVLARSSKLYSMQAAYDKEVEGIVNQMREVLTANGQSTALADQAMASYKAQKSATYSEMMAKLYS